MLSAAGDFGLVIQQIDADEHQGGKLLAVVIVVLEDYVRILIEETQALAVFLIERLGALLAMEMAEELDEFVFEMAYDRILQ